MERAVGRSWLGADAATTLNRRRLPRPRRRSSLLLPGPTRRGPKRNLYPPWRALPCDQRRGSGPFGASTKSGHRRALPAARPHRPRRRTPAKEVGKEAQRGGAAAVVAVAAQTGADAVGEAPTPRQGRKQTAIAGGGMRQTASGTGPLRIWRVRGRRRRKGSRREAARGNSGPASSWRGSARGSAGRRQFPRRTSNRAGR